MLVLKSISVMCLLLNEAIAISILRLFPGADSTVAEVGRIGSVPIVPADW